MKKRKIVISLIITIIGFTALLFVNKNLTSTTVQKQVVYANTNINRGEKLTKNMFKMKNKDITEINKNMLYSLADIDNYYAAENIYIGESLNINRITEEEVIKYDIEKGERLISISFDDIENAVAGILRKGDLVDIIISKHSNDDKITETLEQQARIIDVKDTNEKYIDKNDQSSIAKTLLLAVNPKMEHLIYDSIENGTIRVSKVPEGSSKYNKIIVKNGTIISN